MILAVTLGAVGAHLLKSQLPAKYMETFETGIRYQVYHSLALLWLSDKASKVRVFTPYFFITGIVLFSFNCILYAVTQERAFAMIVPIGGFSFILGWIFLLFELKKFNPQTK